MHLVLRVQTDDALNLETVTEMERLRELLTMNSIQVGNISQASPTEFKVEGIPDATGRRVPAVRG